MKRAPFVLSATAIGVASVLTFRTHALAVPSAAQTAIPSRSSGATGPGSPGTTSPAGSSPPPTSPPTPSTTVPATQAPTTPGPATPAPTTTVPSPTTTSISGTATGEAVNTGYGVVQVRVTVSAGRITGVTTVQLSAPDIHSQEINAQAAPMLHDEVMQAQGPQIDGVSGATYTSQGYDMSLQSALDKLGYKK